MSQRPEARTVREARERMHVLEAELAALAMSPAMALNRFGGEYYLRKARLAVRQAERSMAKSDDPRLPALKPLPAQIRRPVQRERRKRYRCATCLLEDLLYAYEYEKDPVTCPSRKCDGEMQAVISLRRPRNGP